MTNAETLRHIVSNHRPKGHEGDLFRIASEIEAIKRENAALKDGDNVGKLRRISADLREVADDLVLLEREIAAYYSETTIREAEKAVVDAVDYLCDGDHGKFFRMASGDPLDKVLDAQTALKAARREVGR